MVSIAGALEAWAFIRLPAMAGELVEQQSVPLPEHVTPMRHVPTVQSVFSVAEARHPSLYLKCTRQRQELARSDTGRCASLSRAPI